MKKFKIYYKWKNSVEFEIVEASYFEIRHGGVLVLLDKNISEICAYSRDHWEKISVV